MSFLDRLKAGDKIIVECYHGCNICKYDVDIIKTITEKKE